MKIKIVSSDLFSLQAATLVAKEIRKIQRTVDRKINIVFATGNTMVEFLDYLSKEDIDWTKVRAFHLDEYKGLSINSRFSFAYFLNKYLFSKISIPKENIYYINGKNPDLKKYIDILKQSGGADITLLGIGVDGHLAFNESPDSSFDSRIREVKLTETTILSNINDYPEIKNMPFAYTLGIADIFESKNVFLLANKAKKAEIIKRALIGPIVSEVPASILQKHPSTIIILDQEASSFLNKNDK